MKLAEIDLARDIAAKRVMAERLRAKLADGQRLRLTVGEAGDTDEIVLAPAFVETLRADLVMGLARCAAEFGEQLEAMGVET